MWDTGHGEPATRLKQRAPQNRTGTCILAAAADRAGLVPSNAFENTQRVGYRGDQAACVGIARLLQDQIGRATLSTSKASQGCGAVVILKRWRRRICGVNSTLDCFLQRCGQMACRPRPCLFNRRIPALASYEVGRKCSGEHWAVWAPESATKFLPDPASRYVPDRAFS